MILMLLVDGISTDPIIILDEPQMDPEPCVYERPDIAKIIAENNGALELNLSGVGVDNENINLVIDAVQNSTVRDEIDTALITSNQVGDVKDIHSNLFVY